MPKTKEPCGQEAMYRMCWPGKDPIPVCAIHMALGARIGAAMGAYIPLIEAEPETRCMQMVAVEEGAHEARESD